MRFRAFVCVLLSCFLLQPLLSSQQATSTPTQIPQRDSQALSVLSTSFQLMGGSNLSSVQDTRTVVRFRNRTDDSSFPYTATIITKGVNLLRVDSKFPEGTSSFVVTDTGAISEAADQTKSAIPRISFGSAVITHIPALTILSQLSISGAQVLYMGVEQDGIFAVHHIRVQQPLKPTDDLGDFDAPCDIFVDAKTMLVTKILSSIRPPSDLTSREEIEVRYGDFRLMSGIAVPFDVTYSIAGNLLTEQQVVGFDINAGATDESFDLK